MVRINSIPKEKLANAVEFLNTRCGYAASREGEGVNISHSLLKGGLYRPLRIVKAGCPQKNAIDELQKELLKFPTPPGIDLEDLRKKFAAKFPRDAAIGSRVHKLHIPFFYARPSQIYEVVNTLSPYLAEFADVEDVWFVLKSSVVESRLAVMRVSHAVEHIPEIVNPSGRDFAGAQTLERLQSTSALGIAREINFGLSLFSPTLLGIAFDHIGGTYVFTFKAPKSYTVEFPPRFQDILQPNIYSEDKGYQDKNKFREWSFSSSEVETFLLYYIERLSSLHTELLGLENFSDLQGNLDTKRWHLTYSTVLRVFIDATMAQTEYLNQYLRKLMVFRNLDAISHVISINSEYANEPENFQHLCGRSVFEEKVAPALSAFPAPFGNLLRNWSNSMINELNTKILEGIFVPGRRASGRVRAGDKEMSEDSYVTAFLREVRNTQHGYSIRKFPILQIHDGNLPDCLGDMSKFIVLAYLQNHKFILGSELFS